MIIVMLLQLDIYLNLILDIEMAKKKPNQLTEEIEFENAIKDVFKDIVFCRIKNNVMFLKMGGTTDYKIELSRCDTPLKILNWTLHLTEKSWINCDRLNSFIKLACDANEIDIHSVDA